ncbi:MAG TPA: STAS domain-containing protein [Chitinispirillaceae bacterium]|nr:STAS domain-containing protein [Chitinispirillaceae bacterium]
MEINTRRFGKWFIIAVCGKFVLKNLTEIRMFFENSESNLWIAVDLKKTTILDSSALTILTNFHKRLQNKGGKLVIFEPDRYIADVFSIVGFDRLISIYNTEEEFRKSCE